MKDKKTLIQVYVSESQKKQLFDIAKKESMSVSCLLRRMAEETIKNYKDSH